MPMRLLPDHRSEMVNQLLYGESFVILDRNKNWVKITCLHDQYTGWMESDLFAPVDQNVPIKMVALSFQRFRLPEGISWLPFGSYVPDQSGTPSQNHDHLSMRDGSDKKTSLFYFKRKFLGAPYLWGGRTAMGIDCSGLSQLFMRFLGLNIPRDASQQVETGMEVFQEDVQAGDLAFFSSESERISHVGIIQDKSKIFHASGNVRTDFWDGAGIRRQPSGRLTHHLKTIRRIIIPH